MTKNMTKITVIRSMHTIHPLQTLMSKMNILTRPLYVATTNFYSRKCSLHQPGIGNKDYIDVGDGCWKRNMLVTTLRNISSANLAPGTNTQKMSQIFKLCLQHLCSSPLKTYGMSHIGT